MDSENQSDSARIDDDCSADESELKVKSTKIENDVDEEANNIEMIHHPIADMISVPERAEMRNITPKKIAQKTVEQSTRKKSIKKGTMGSREFQ